MMLGAQVLASFVLNDKYGIDAVGQYALVLAVAQIVVVGVSLPFSSLIRRDLSLQGLPGAASYAADVNFFRFANILIVVLVTVLVMPFFSESLKGIKIFLLLMLLTKGAEVLNDTYFVTYQAVSNYTLYASLKVSYAFLILASLLAVFLGNYPLFVFYYLQLAIAIAFLIFNHFLFRYKISSYKTVAKTAVLFNNSRKYILREVWPMIINSLLSQGSSKLNAVIIFHFIGTKELGVFSILIMFSNIFAGVGNSIGIVTIGKFTVLIEESVNKFKIFFTKSLFIFLGLGIIMAIIYFVVLPFLLKFYQFDSMELGWLNIVIGIAIPFLFVTSCISNIFLIIKRQVSGVYVSLMVLLINIALYIGFSYSMGIAGAGYAYLLIAMIQLSLILIWVFGNLRRSLLTIKTES